MLFLPSNDVNISHLLVGSRRVSWVGGIEDKEKSKIVFLFNNIHSTFNYFCVRISNKFGEFFDSVT